MRNDQLTKKMLDENIVDQYAISGGQPVYVSKIKDEFFAYQKLDDILVPEYSSGDYRVCRGDFYTDDHVFFVED